MGIGCGRHGFGGVPRRALAAFGGVHDGDCVVPAQRPRVDTAAFRDEPITY